MFSQLVFEYRHLMFWRLGGVAPIVLILSELVSGYPVIFEDKDGVTAYTSCL